MGGNKKNVDPLFLLFEHYLFKRSYENFSAFTQEVAEEYLSYLDSSPAHVPFHTRSHLLKDLQSEAHELLLKKMYGCVRMTDYLNKGQVMRIEAELMPVEFSPPTELEEDPKK